MTETSKGEARAWKALYLLVLVAIAVGVNKPRGLVHGGGGVELDDGSKMRYDSDTETWERDRPGW